MELNKNKIIFLWIWSFLLLAIIFLILTLNNNWPREIDSSSQNTFKIWMLWQNNAKSNDIIEGFKQIYPNYRSRNIVIETFPSYEDYILTLSSSFISWNWPDIFVLNNNEKDSLFSNQIVWIDTRVINPNDFRKKYKSFFSEDLIISSWDVEFLKWIPVWYETLWIFYNRAHVRHADLENLSSLNNLIADLWNRNPWVIPIWIWNWSTVNYVSDILTQFFMLEWWVSWLQSITWNVLRQAISAYLLYWDINWYNRYNSKFLELTNLRETSLYLFSRWETHMVVWYPSMINKIKDYWYSASFLQARAFPHYFSWNGKTLVNYDYFVINNDSPNRNLALDFLSYLYSDNWANNFLSVYTYLLPWLLSLESDKLEQKIHSDFNIILRDFYREEQYLSSFDKWIKYLYDREIIWILDNSSYAEANFSDFRDSVLCKRNKIINLEWLSINCD